MSFHNPYHFVPVKPNPRIESREGRHVTHAQYVAGTEEHDTRQPVYSGRLLCRLTTEDPIVVGSQREEVTVKRPAGQQKKRGDQQDTPHRVYPFELANQPALPASTLRGLLSAVAEAASNSALRVLEDRPYSYRAAMQESLPAMGMIVEETQADKTTVRKLRPLALPPFPWNNREKQEEILRKYDQMFPQPLLKIYINGYRKKNRQQTPHLELTPGSFLDRVRPQSYSADRREFWYLRVAGPCTKEGDRITISAPYLSKKGWLLGQKAVVGSEPLSEAEYQALPLQDQKKYTRGILRVLGIEGRVADIPTTKKHEIFLPYPPELETALVFEAEEACVAFEALAAERTATDDRLPFSVRGSRRNTKTGKEKQDQTIRLRGGDVVFFKPAEDNPSKVGEVAISSIWRRRAGGGSHDYFRELSPELLPYHPERTGITLAEQIFGYVEQRPAASDDSRAARALASRIRVSFGLYASHEPQPYEDEVLLKILDAPKPPSPALYFTQRNGKKSYIAKRELHPDAHMPQGRKFYLHRQTNTKKPWQTAAPTENLKQKSWVRPLKPDSQFYFHLDFDNLSQRELGLVCYALRPTENFRHKLGMGKPLGLGRVRIDPVGVFYVDRLARYRETLLFGAQRYHGSWVAEPENPATWPSRYTREKEAAESAGRDAPTFETLRQAFRDEMEPDIRQALELLGDPTKITSAVHTPQVAGTIDRAMESETYRWFVANERNADRRRKRGEFLAPLDQNSTEMPTLSELSEKEKHA